MHPARKHPHLFDADSVRPRPGCRVVRPISIISGRIPDGIFNATSERRNNEARKSLMNQGHSGQRHRDPRRKSDFFTNKIRLRISSFTSPILTKASSKKKINTIFVFDGSGARLLCTQMGDYKWMDGQKVVMSTIYIGSVYNPHVEAKK